MFAELIKLARPAAHPFSLSSFLFSKCARVCVCVSEGPTRDRARAAMNIFRRSCDDANCADFEQVVAVVCCFHGYSTADNVARKRYHLDLKDALQYARRPEPRDTTHAL